ncbi:hypothetical protein U0070_021160 [Myodes glareolus]|uniref:Uncharacterized protein n=1 Tax=Myodes glareolus TaxID=447135 RepID=A0AAW0ILD7_MYOGA
MNGHTWYSSDAPGDLNSGDAYRVDQQRLYGENFDEVQGMDMGVDGWMDGWIDGWMPEPLQGQTTEHDV